MSTIYNQFISLVSNKQKISNNMFINIELSIINNDIYEYINELLCHIGGEINESIKEMGTLCIICMWNGEVIGSMYIGKCIDIILPNHNKLIYHSEKCTILSDKTQENYRILPLYKNARNVN